jgi:hypothetical protein
VVWRQIIHQTLLIYFPLSITVKTFLRIGVLYGTVVIE